MAIITKTTRPLDVEIQLPDLVIYPSLSAQTLLYKTWQDSFVSPNPIETQVSFFQNIAQQIQTGILDLEFYLYWYNKAKTSHPIVIAILPLSATTQYQDINESIGNLYFAQPNNATIPINTLASSSLKPYPNNIETLLITDLNNLLINAYNIVDTIFANNISKIQIDPTAMPTAAHGISLVKDTIANTRNTQSQPLIKLQLETLYGVALNLTEIENVFTGDINIINGVYQTNIEGINVNVDDLTNIINPTLSTLTISSLQAQ